MAKDFRKSYYGVVWCGITERKTNNRWKNQTHFLRMNCA